MRINDRLMKLLFVIACAFALLVEVIPGRPPSTDEEFFKSAGRNWAATGHFAAPEVVGRVDVKPSLDVVYFAQPPLYSFIFGVYTRIAGFGPFQCILFDVLIHLLLAACTVLLARRVFQVPTVFAYAVGIFVLPMGTRGRPDELAMCLAVAGTVCWTLDVAPRYRALLAGVAFGLCGATSIGVLLFLSPMAFLVAHHRRVLTLWTAGLAVCSGIAVGLLCVSPILIPHPDAYKQLLAHASDQSPELGREVEHGQSRWASIVHSYEDGTRFALHYGSADIAAPIGAVVLIVLCLWSMPKEGSRQRKQCAAVAVAGMAAEWAILPGKATYIWFFAPWLLSLSAIVLARSLPTLRGGLRALALLAIVFFVAVGSAIYVKNRLVMLTLPENQSFYRNMDQVRSFIPAGSRVVTREYWWALADKCQVFDPDFSRPNPIDVDYLITNGNGSRVPGNPQAFSPYFADFARGNHFVVIEDALNRQPFKLGGIRITNSGYGFGAYVLARR